MIDSIHAYDSTIKIGLAVTIPAYDQKFFLAKSMAIHIGGGDKRNVYLWTRDLINQFKGKEAQGVYLVPINTNLDTRYNMGLEDTRG